MALRRPSASDAGYSAELPTVSPPCIFDSAASSKSFHGPSPLPDIGEFMPFSPASLKAPVVPQLRFAQAKEEAGAVNGYAIIEKVGSGRFGKVFLVSGPDGQRFALKVCERQKLAKIFGAILPSPLVVSDAPVPACSPRTSEYDALCHEVRLLRAVCHPHIVRVFDAFETTVKTYILMELLEHRLLELNTTTNRFVCPVSRTAMCERHAQIYAMHILTAASYLHAGGTSHGDIKPDNVMLRCVGSEGRYEAVLADFGKASQRFSAVAGPIGTLAFSSPESFDGPFDMILCDMWAIGVTIFCMVFGSLPFTVEHGRLLLDDDDTASKHALVTSIQSLQWRTALPSSLSDAESTASDQLLSLLEGLLCPADRRMEAAEALTHPWLQDL